MQTSPALRATSPKERILKIMMGVRLVRKYLNMIKGLQDGQDKGCEMDENSRIE